MIQSRFTYSVLAIVLVVFATCDASRSHAAKPNIGLAIPNEALENFDNTAQILLHFQWRKAEPALPHRTLTPQEQHPRRLTAGFTDLSRPFTQFQRSRALPRRKTPTMLEPGTALDALFR